MSDERYFCVHCQEADVQRCDEDLCCLSCGVDLVALADLQTTLSRAGLALVPAADVQALAEARRKLVEDKLDSVLMRAERAVLEACSDMRISTVVCGTGGQPTITSSTARLARAELALRAAKGGNGG